MLVSSPVWFYSKTFEEVISNTKYLFTKRDEDFIYLVLEEVGNSIKGIRIVYRTEGFTYHSEFEITKLALSQGLRIKEVDDISKDIQLYLTRLFWGKLTLRNQVEEVDAHIKEDMAKPLKLKDVGSEY